LTTGVKTKVQCMPRCSGR